MMMEPSTTQQTVDELKAASLRFEGQSPQTVLAYALEQYFPNIVLACSFGAEDVVLVDMMYRINQNASLFYLDTDFLFPETHQVRERIAAKYHMTPSQMIQVKSEYTPEAQAARFGDRLWINQPDQCCQLRKVDPLNKTLKEYRAWITGIRRDQGPTRANACLIEWDTKFGLVKCNPLAAWSQDDVWAYIKAHDVPYNPLHDQHYPSIGCTHCTGPVRPGDDPRSGRWGTMDKTECGLHR